MHAMESGFHSSFEQPKSSPGCVCCSDEMLLQDTASLKTSLLALFCAHLWREAAERRSLLIFLLIFHRESPNPVFLWGSALCLGRQTASQAKDSSGSHRLRRDLVVFKSLFTLKRACQTPAFRMTCLWALSATSPLDIGLLWRTELSTHPDVYLWVHRCYQEHMQKCVFAWMCVCGCLCGVIGQYK